MQLTTPRVAVVAVAAAAVLAGCGDSAEETATTQVCTARDDIAQHVDALKGMTVTTATTTDVKDRLQAIRQDLSKIADARGDLSDDNRQQVETANDAFRTTVRETAQTVLRTTSVEEAGTQLEAALQQLAATYRDTFAQVDCS